MKKALSTLMAVIVLNTTAVACFSSYEVAPQELYKLNGFREGQNVELYAVDGTSFKFNSKTDLNVEAGDGQAMTAKYSAVQVNGSTMTGTVRGSGAPVNIDLSQVTAVNTKQLSVGRTVGLAAGLGGGLIITAIVLALVLPYAINGGGGFSEFR